MDLEKLEKAKELQQNILFLKTKILMFDKSKRCAYLHVKDHFGNGNCIIETYSLDRHYANAAGSKFESFICNAYGDFLDKVRIEMQQRIDYLQNEFDNI